MIRLLGVLLVLFLIFQVGVSFGQQTTVDEQVVISDESDLDETNTEVEGFEVKHEQKLQENSSRESGLFAIAKLIETSLKGLFSILFEFLHRFAMLFW